MRPLVWHWGVVLVLLGAACGDRTIPAESAGQTATDDSAAPGTPSAYESCMSVDDCDPEPYCIYPRDESGFCTEACDTAEDCPRPSSATATTTCAELEQEKVCVLRCTDGKSCPAHMRCQRVMLGNTDGKFCF